MKRPSSQIRDTTAVPLQSLFRDDGGTPQQASIEHRSDATSLVLIHGDVDHDPGIVDVDPVRRWSRQSNSQFSPFRLSSDDMRVLIVLYSLFALVISAHTAPTADTPADIVPVRSLLAVSILLKNSFPLPLQGSDLHLPHMRPHAGAMLTSTPVPSLRQPSPRERLPNRHRPQYHRHRQPANPLRYSRPRATLRLHQDRQRVLAGDLQPHRKFLLDSGVAERGHALCVGLPLSLGTRPLRSNAI